MNKFFQLILISFFVFSLNSAEIDVLGTSDDAVLKKYADYEYTKESVLFCPEIKTELSNFEGDILKYLVKCELTEFVNFLLKNQDKKDIDCRTALFEIYYKFYIQDKNHYFDLCCELLNTFKAGKLEKQINFENLKKLEDEFKETHAEKIK